MEFNEIVVKESPGLCRCCLSEGCYKDLGSEYNWMNETEIYADMLLECFDISVTQHNEGPNGPNRLICEVCITRLRDACNFKKQVLDSEKKFIDMVARGEFRPKILVYQTNMKAEDTLEAPAEDGEVEFLDEEINFGDDELIKDESEEPSVSNITVTTLPIKTKRGRPPKTSALIKPEKKIKVSKLEEKPRTSKAVPKGRKRKVLSSIQETYLDRLSKIRRNILNVLRYGTVVPFTWSTKGFSCFYCKKSMKDCDILKEHTINHANIDLDAFIPKKIITKDIPIKIDIQNVACKLCPGIHLNDLEELIYHIINTHNEKYDLNAGVCVIPFVLRKENMQCVLCDSKYDNFTSMIGHMHKEHMTHSYICQNCGLRFVSHIRLKRHIKNSHIGFRCTVCGKLFDTSHRMEKHKEKLHGQTKTYECNLCSHTFANIYQLKVHLGKVHNVEKYLLKCEFCPKICNTKGALVLHVKLMHTDSKVYQCDVCEYKSGIKWLITLHKRKHNNEREYACSLCERLFRRSSNLRMHMKVHSGSPGRVCRICRKGFPDLDALNGHKVEAHYFDNC